jgi:hypothetical protein
MLVRGCVKEYQIRADSFVTHDPYRRQEENAWPKAKEA